jgi:hypothetical protein
MNAPITYGRTIARKAIIHGFWYLFDGSSEA